MTLVLMLVLAAAEPASASSPAATTAAPPPPNALGQDDTAGDDGGASDPLVEESDIFAILDEEEETYSGARTVTRVRESGSNVWVIQRQAIEAMAATNVTDLLRLIPGIYVREISPSLVETSTRFPVIVPDNQTLFLIDGRSIQFDIFGQTDKMGIEVGDIERIEVIMGPSSTLYGTNAYAGVVNIVTKTATTLGVTSSANLRVGIATGTQGQIGSGPGSKGQVLGRAFVETSYKTADFGFRASVGADYLPSFTPVLMLGAQTFGLAPHKRVNAAVTTTQTAGGWSLRQRLAATLHESMFIAFRPSVMSFQDYSLTLLANRPSLLAEGDELSIIAWGRYSTIEHEFVLADFKPTPYRPRTATGEIFAQYRTAPFFGNQLTFGAQVRMLHFGEIQIEDRARFQHVYGVFIEDEWRPIKQLVLTAGVRLETSESPVRPAFSLFNLAPRGSIVWLVNDNHSLRLELASAFRNPNTYERFARAENPDGIPIFRGNPALTSETLQQLSLGYNGHVSWLGIRAEIFAMRASGIILPQRVGAGNEATEVLGFPVQAYPGFGSKLPEVWGNLTDQFIIPGASLRLEATIERAGEKAGKVWLYYHATPLAPNHMAGLGGQFTFGRVTASSQLYYVDPFTDVGADLDRPGTNEYAGRIILNARVAVALDAAGKFQLALAGTNLLDIRLFRYAVTDHFPTDFSDSERIGQRVWLELSVAL